MKKVTMMIVILITLVCAVAATAATWEALALAKAESLGYTPVGVTCTADGDKSAYCTVYTTTGPLSLYCDQINCKDIGDRRPK